MITTEVISFVRRDNNRSKPVTFNVGLSSDSKKELNAANGSIFKEIDTGKVFIFDEETNEWRMQG